MTWWCGLLFLDIENVCLFKVIHLICAIKISILNVIDDTSMVPT